MKLTVFGAILLFSFAKAFPEVQELGAEADFKQVLVHWAYNNEIPKRYDFHVRYCEVQPWGPHRCRTKVLDGGAVQLENSIERKYAVEIEGLRMLTNYTISVNPTPKGQSLRGRSLGKAIVIQTKGFSAKATKCLSDFSEVEVETGPNFGGIISVEGSTDPLCSIQGDIDSPTTKYMLTIQHTRCGSNINGSSIQVYILVQENQYILTHSTRRFLVLCTFTPDSFTVKAGVSLPRGDTNKVDNDNMRPVAKAVYEVNPADLFPIDSANAGRVNNVIDSRAQHEQRAFASAHTSDNEELDEAKGNTVMGQAVLLAVVAVGSVFGIIMASWWIISSGRRSVRTESTSQQEDLHTEIFENCQNFHRENPTSTPSVVFSASQSPTVALLSVRATSGDCIELCKDEPGQSDA